MNKELISGLEKMTNAEWHQLKLRLQVAALCRSLMTEFEIDEKTMRQKLAIPPRKFKAFLNGAYPYRLNHISDLHTLQEMYECERIKKRIDEKLFPPYTYSEPATAANNQGDSQ